MNFTKFSAIFALSCGLFACDSRENPVNYEEISHDFVAHNALTTKYDSLTCQGDIFAHNGVTCVLHTKFGEFTGTSEFYCDFFYLNTDLPSATVNRLIDSGVTLQWAAWEVLRRGESLPRNTRDSAW